MDKLLPSSSTALRRLGDTGPAAFAAAHASFIIAFATTPMDNILSAGSATLRTYCGWVPEVEDIKGPHQHTKYRANCCAKSHENILIFHFKHRKGHPKSTELFA